MNDNIARKIFVSYKYKDFNVYIDPVSEFTPGEDTDFLYTPRHYVDKIIGIVGKDNIYKGELGDEDMDDLTDDTIDSKLKEKIFDSSVTIILISPNMWDKNRLEKDQWISKEILYSLKNKTRGDKTSKTNAMLAVVLPDVNGSYEYAVVDKACGVRSWQTNTFFRIIRKNMFNRWEKKQNLCTSCLSHHHYGGDHSYIHPVKWCDFISNHNDHINHVLDLREKMDDEFNITRSNE